MTPANGSLLRVTAGTPTTEEIAALVAALVGSACPPQAVSTPPAAPVWVQAGRWEALGRPPVATPHDLRRPGQGVGGGRPLS